MVRSTGWPGAGAVLLLLSACGGGGSAAGTSGVGSPPPPAAPKAFTDVTSTSGISFAVGITPSPDVPVQDVTSGGAAAGDCDGDGDIDLFITAGDAGTGANRLYLNQLYLNRQGARGNPLQFVDAAVQAGVAYTRDSVRMQNYRHSGPTFADMDGDGDLDLFLGALFGDPLKVFENDGDCRFRDVTANSPEIVAIEARHTISAAFGDYDLDGDLDMFLSHWGTHDSIYDAHPVWTTEHLWENRHNVTGRIEFVNVSVASSVSAITGTTRDHPDTMGDLQVLDLTFTPTFARMDADEWPDIAIAGDYGTSQLLLNNRDGSFRDSGHAILRDAQFGMGSSLGDFDNDGDLDWFVTSIHHENSFMSGNRLFENLENGTGMFGLHDSTDSADVAAGGWGWASCFLDINNDGFLDIYHVNGWPHEFERHTFSDDVTAVFVFNGTHYVKGAATLGLDDRYSGRGAVCADFDEDGDVDILQLTTRLPNSGVLWENRTAAAGNNHIRVRLQGLAPNTEAAGARIYVTAGGVTQMREITIGSNYISQNPAVQHFGLGAAANVDSVRVVWPARVPGPGLPAVQPADSVLPSPAVPVIMTNRTLVISQAP
jgi:hypothetical protein